MSALWVFGYGSLMWRPGFPFDAQSPARLEGAHRALCIYSILHRGTLDNPGLVLGLDDGGDCHGLAFRVEPGTESDTVAYLRRREQVTDVYVETYREIALGDGTGQTVTALTFVADPHHPQYAGLLDLEAQLRIVRAGRGQAGANIDYVLNTVEHLEALGMHDALLFTLAERLRRSAGDGAET
ncbi:MAG: gamma-glutamylcyclotransferase [Methyloceanibacter sp.]|jgi:cation transport protein ChaC|uniref:gamma-glutamylcyclotransferase n=1 Tax=Methyloceanibacter sp. TaxID=1965321 RepID=UPI003C52410B